ncbi:hypothetical protein LOC67_21820 [Stieleria sp. JC731]|uniref:SHD1 domain-containing protein n=1 Tax=Pirellulaceae TaxID=2691357 RepID=UPI001E3C3B1C|nr:SHD1 domain-containing protein [Stieleria sp. JC731]MCC9603195.1 hypothetical protein [Stieleria sp. JC731]
MFRATNNTKNLRLACMLLALTVGLFGNGSTSVADDLRVWRDSTGNFSVEATLISVDAGTVYLETPTGRKIDVPLTRLSKEDRSFLRSVSESPANERVASRESKPKSAIEIHKSIQLALRGKPTETPSEMPLSEFLSKLPFPTYLDSVGLSSIGLSDSQSIRPNANATTLAEQLDTTFASLTLSWQARQTVVVVSVSDRESLMIHPQVYLANGVHPQALIERLKTIETGSWEERGGPGSVGILGSRVIVRQTPEIHRRIERELNLRQAVWKYVHPLDQVVVNFPKQSLPLTGFAGSIEKQTGIAVEIDEASFKNIGLSPDVSVEVDFPGCSAAEVLDLVLGSVEATWIERDKKIIFCTTDQAEKELLPTRIPFRSPGAGNRLLLVFQIAIKPDRWESLGGRSQIQMAGNGAVMLRADSQVTREVIALAATLVGR